MPVNTSGMAKHRKATATVTAQSTPQSIQQVTDDDVALPAQDIVIGPATVVPRTTMYRHKIREEMGLAPVNKRQRIHNFCKNCRKPRTKETGHSCQRGHLYCPDNSEGLSVQQWRDRLYSTVLSKYKK
jgi:hypothetical protein